MGLDAEHRQHLKNLPAVMRLVLDHRAKPFPGSDARARRSLTLFLKILVREPGKNLNRLLSS
jgi:hypothetical protein